MASLAAALAAGCAVPGVDTGKHTLQPDQYPKPPAEKPQARWLQYIDAQTGENKSVRVLMTPTA